MKVTGALPLTGLTVAVNAPHEPNHHDVPWAPAQWNAYDLQVIDQTGHLHRGDGSQLEQWVGFGQPVLSPVSGTVVQARDGRPDHAPGTDTSTDPDAHTAPGGNEVVVRMEDGTHIVLAHLQQGSVRTDLAGRVIRAGQVVGRLGNSGNTTAPHLHVHAQRSWSPGDVWRAQGALLAFEGVERIGRYVTEPDSRQGWRTLPTSIDGRPRVLHAGDVVRPAADAIRPRT